MSIALPEKKVKPVHLNPRLLVIYSKPKAGKTEALSRLEESLLLDFERGSDFVEAMKININSFSEYVELSAVMKSNIGKYKYIAVDTATALEEMSLEYAASLYKSTPMGKNWSGTDVRKLPNGAGYGYIREAFFRILDDIRNWSEHTIITAHIKDKMINSKGEEVSAADIDLTGKIKSLISAKSDAIGYLYRRENQSILTFKGSDLVTCGARSPHLRNKEIILLESDDSGVVSANWDKVYV